MNIHHPRGSGISGDDAEMKELEKTGVTLQCITDTSPIAFVGINRNGYVTLWNPAAEKIFGWAREEVTGKKFPFSFGRAHAEFQQLFDTVLEGKNGDIELDCIGKNGTSLNVKLWMNPIQGANSEIIGVMSIIADITEVKKLEQQFLHAQKMESVGRLAGGIAHDVNNYLSAISGYSELLRMKLTDDPDISNKIDAVIDIVYKASSLIEQLLAFSKKQSIKPKILNLNRTVKQMEKMMRQLIGENIELKTLLQENLWNVKIDPSQMEQIIVNLLVNGRDAIQGGGSITLETRNISENSTCVQWQYDFQPGDYAMLAVSDSGAGIPENVIDKIFEPFFTTKEKSKGSGLGLSTIYGIVKQNKGHIHVESTAGRETVFSVYLPKCREQTPKKIGFSTFANPEIGSFGKILFVDDNPEVRDSTKAFLEEMGHEVITGENGEEALKIFEEHADEIGLLISDIMMPGINGRTLARQIQAKNPDIMVLFISGYPDNLLNEQNLIDDEINFLQKPFLARDLAKKLRQMGR